MKKILLNTVISSDRIELRKVSDAVSDAMFRYLTPAVTRPLTFSPPRDLEEQRASVRRLVRANYRGDAWHAGIFLKPSGEYLGCCGVVAYDRKSSSVEIGYWLAEKYQGNG